MYFICIFLTLLEGYAVLFIKKHYYYTDMFSHTPKEIKIKRIFILMYILFAFIPIFNFLLFAFMILFPLLFCFVQEARLVSKDENHKESKIVLKIKKCIKYLTESI